MNLHWIFGENGNKNTPWIQVHLPATKLCGNKKPMFVDGQDSDR